MPSVSSDNTAISEAIQVIRESVTSYAASFVPALSLSANPYFSPWEIVRPTRFSGIEI